MKTNVALHKHASQSSYSRWSKPDESAQAVNGSKSGNFSFHTDTEEHAWWQLDLGKAHNLHSIVIYNRDTAGSELAERAKSMAVFISDNGMNWLQLYAGGQSFGGVLDKSPLSLTCNGKQARFVRLQLQEKNYLHLDEIEVYAENTTPSLRSLGSLYGTDKGAHGFCDIYEQAFSQMRPRVTKILEIGVFFGASLCMWRDWFPNATIHGADHFTGLQGNGSIFANADKFFKEVAIGQHPRITLHQLDQSQRVDLAGFAAKHLHASFDLIIDDASHLMKDQQQTLGALFCLVKPGGFFVLEDLHSSLHPDYDVTPDGSNSTLLMIERALAGSGWHSDYLAPHETDFLDSAIDLLKTKIYRSGNSLTCIIRRHTEVIPINPAEIKQGSITIVNYASFDPLNQTRQQQHIKWAQQWAKEALTTPESGITSIDISCFGPDALDSQFCEQNEYILSQKRGGGFWLWKPYVIAAMLAATTAEFIVYCDSGSTILKPLPELLAALRDSGAAVLAFDLTSKGWYEQHWTKGQVLRAMDATEPMFAESGQLGATVSVWRVCDASRKIASEWLTLLQNPDFATDSPSVDGQGDFLGFREHRHDQSVFSILIKKAMHSSTNFPPVAIIRDFRSWIGHHHIA